MKNKISVEENLINLISKIGEKITVRRAKFFNKKQGKNYFYVHSSIDKNIGKIVSVVKLLNSEDKDLGQKMAMHIAATNPISIDKDGIEKSIIDKELEIIKEELMNSGKKEILLKKFLKVK